MSPYYEDGYYSERKHFPWALIIVLMLIAAIGGGFFSYYLINGNINERLAAVDSRALPNDEAQSALPAESSSTVVNTTQLLLSPEAMESLLGGSGSSSVIDLIYGEVANIYDKVSPSIVGISNIVKYSSYFGGFGFGNRNQGAGREIEVSSGSGVVYSSNGYIVTNNHVVSGADRLVVTLYDGSTEEAEIIGTDERSDIALIKINRSDLVAAGFGDSSTLRVGDFALAIGNPGGETFSRSLTTGTVSGLDRIVATEEGLELAMIQTDAAINPGNSGGALVNSRGEVIGINTVKISNTAYEGMGFAIPINTVQEILNDLMQYHKVLRPYLGVRMLRDIDSVFAQYNELGVTQGVLVAPIEGKGAEAAGIEDYDIILAIDGKEIASSGELQSFVFNNYAIGDTVRVTVYRYTTDETFDVEVTLSEME